MKMEQAIKEAGVGGQVQDKEGFSYKVDEDGITLRSQYGGCLLMMSSKQALDDGWSVVKP